MAQARQHPLGGQASDARLVSTCTAETRERAASTFDHPGGIGGLDPGRGGPRLCASVLDPQDQRLPGTSLHSIQMGRQPILGRAMARSRPAARAGRGARSAAPRRHVQGRPDEGLDRVVWRGTVRPSATGSGASAPGPGDRHRRNPRPPGELGHGGIEACPWRRRSTPGRAPLR